MLTAILIAILPGVRPSCLHRLMVPSHGLRLLRASNGLYGTSCIVPVLDERHWPKEIDAQPREEGMF
ncbi:hypothetical protein KDA_52200 [Dictyobacter alpinus]|uniref:Uncharacterized protein n=1 Tax=Dictyobacter alpinus TaxID=2014873 RepID=A0A402BEK5_9CHLR|nr:hypothetical protein KDA_52200 [Dictyobacter alpinus]